MKNLITVLAIAALMTSCQKDELSGVTESEEATTVSQTEQVTDAFGSWDVISVHSFSNSAIDIGMESIIINGDTIYTYYSIDSNFTDTSSYFEVESEQLYTDSDRIIVSIDDLGELTLIYTVRRIIVKATRN